MAKILHPTIIRAVEQALKQGMKEITKDIQTHDQRIGDTEQRISELEDDLQRAQILITKADKQAQDLQDKLEDLKNRSRRNNLRVIGLPETYKPQQLLEIWHTRSIVA